MTAPPIACLDGYDDTTATDEECADRLIETQRQWDERFGITHPAWCDRAPACTTCADDGYTIHRTVLGEVKGLKVTLDQIGDGMPTVVLGDVELDGEAYEEFVALLDDAEAIRGGAS